MSTTVMGGTSMNKPLVTTGGIAAALAKAQSAIKAAIKDSENPAFKNGGKVSKYADLAAVWEACREPLSKNDLSIVQTTDFDDKDVWLVTTLMHSSGESIIGRYPLRPVKHDPQGFGSALTYARRYTIAAMVGVVADDDDDGNAASGRNGNGHHTNGNGAKITSDQVDTLRGMIINADADVEKFCTYMNVGSLAEIPASRFPIAVDALNAKIKAAKVGK